jgi:MSHA biogenesis protein MshJ
VKALTDAIQKIDALSLRERAILFVLMLAGIWAAMDALLLAPQERARKLEQGKVTQARAKLAEAEQALVLRGSQPDPDQAARQRLENARLGLNARLQTATRLQARMIAPKDTVRVLQGLLATQPGLRLVSLETLPPQAVGQSSQGRATPADAQPAATDKASPALSPQQGDAAFVSAKAPTTALFKHGVKLTLVGNYAALTQYMEKLERLPVGFYWARAELDASAHPEIRLTLTLYTLSLERTWLTV